MLSSAYSVFLSPGTRWPKAWSFFLFFFFPSRGHGQRGCCDEGEWPATVLRRRWERGNGAVEGRWRFSDGAAMDERWYGEVTVTARGVWPFWFAAQAPFSSTFFCLHLSLGILPIFFAWGHGLGANDVAGEIDDDSLWGKTTQQWGNRDWIRYFRVPDLVLKFEDLRLISDELELVMN